MVRPHGIFRFPKNQQLWLRFSRSLMHPRRVTKSELVYLPYGIYGGGMSGANSRNRTAENNRLLLPACEFCVHFYHQGMLKFPYRPRPRRFPKGDGLKPDGHGTGPLGRITKMRKVVTAVVRHERIEMSYPLCDESRGYVERVRAISFVSNGIRDTFNLKRPKYRVNNPSLLIR